MSQNHLLRTTAIALALATGGGLSGTAMAQTAPAKADTTTSLPEVVVTARARPEKLLNVPISVQSFSAASLAEDNIHDLGTLQAEAGFTFNSAQASYGGGGRQYPDLTFRGLWSNVGGAVGGSSGALFVDGVYVSGGFASVTFADVASVEVLKGPQNVYFGKNTFGGAVNLITSNPSEDYHGKASVGYSTMGSYDDTASVEGAIIPGLLTGRLTAELYHQGEQYKSFDGGPLGEQDTKGVTAVLYATPSSDVWVRTRFHFSHDEDSAAAEGEVDANGEDAAGGTGPVYGTNCPGVLNKYFCNGIPSLGKVANPSSVLVASNIDPYELASIQSNNFYGSPERWGDKAPKVNNYGLVRDNLQASLTGGVKLPYDSTFQVNVGYNQAASDDAIRADHIGLPTSAVGADGPYITFDSNVVSITRDFSADARIVSSPSNPLRGVFGVNFFRSIDQVNSSGYVFTNSLDTTEAVYGSLEYDILKNLTVTVEGRYQRDSLSDTPGSLTYTQNQNTFLPRALLSYKPTKSTNLYLSYSEGIQPPQINPAYVAGQTDKICVPTSPPAAPGCVTGTGAPYLANALAAIGDTTAFTKDPKVRVWEIGWKQSLFEHRVNFSIDYYNQYWDNALVDTFVFDPTSCRTLYGTAPSYYYVENQAGCPFGSSGKESYSPSQNHIQGIEFEGTARITRKWTTHGTVNWTHAIRDEYSELSTCGMFTTGVCPNENGLAMDQVPEWQAEADTTYKDHLTGPYDWYIHGAFTYTGQQYIDPTDIGYIDGYFRVNSSAGIVRGNLTLEVYVTNLLDDKNWDSAYRFPSSYFGYQYQHMAAIVQAPNPRNVGFKLSSKF
jgi:iron complex outermembrane receptor protein